MKIILYPSSQLVHHKTYLNNFKSGLDRHNLSSIIKTRFFSDDCPDLAVVWGHKNKQLINYMKQNNKPYIVMERGYIGDRSEWTSCGYNGLNGRAEFCNSHITDIGRFNKHFSNYLKDYKNTLNGRYALLIGQVIGDSALEHVDIFEWYRDRIKELNELGIPVLFREHPLNKNKFHDDSLIYTKDTNEHLETSLETCRFVVTYSSNSGVISVLNGYPTLSYDCGSMVYDVTSHDINNISTIQDRHDWCCKIAYTQWNKSEITSGETWEHLKNFIDNS